MYEPWEFFKPKIAIKNDFNRVLEWDHRCTARNAIVYKNILKYNGKGSLNAFTFTHYNDAENNERYKFINQDTSCGSATYDTFKYVLYGGGFSDEVASHASYLSNPTTYGCHEEFQLLAKTSTVYTMSKMIAMPPSEWDHLDIKDSIHFEAMISQEMGVDLAQIVEVWEVVAELENQVFTVTGNALMEITNVHT